MPGQRVEISYEAYVKGVEKLDDLIRKNAELGNQVEDYKKKLDKVREQEEKNESVNLKLRRGILAFRKELFAIAVAAGAVTAAIKLLSFGSDALTERLEKLVAAGRKLSAPFGNFIAQLFGNRGQLSTEAEVRKLGLESDVASLQGNNRLALVRRLEAEEKKLIKETGTLWETTYKKIFDERKRLMLEAQRFEELGLKRQFEIVRQLKQEIIAGVRSGISDPIFKLLQGEQQTFGDVLKGFQTGLNRALANSIGEAVTSSLFGGGNFLTNLKNVFSGRTQAVVAQEKTTEAVKEMHQTLTSVSRCVCETAANTAALGTSRMPSISFEPGKGPSKGLGIASAIVGGVGLIAGAAGGLSLPKGPAPLPPGAGISFPDIPKFQSGGEVPAMLHAGEFVVNRDAAAKNKSALHQINSGGSMGNNFYVSINAVDAKSFDDMMATPASRARMEMQVIRAIMENSEIRRVIRDFAK